MTNAMISVFQLQVVFEKRTKKKDQASNGTGADKNVVCRFYYRGSNNGVAEMMVSQYVPDEIFHG